MRIVAAAVVVALGLVSVAHAAAPDWGPLNWLVGRWVGEGGGAMQGKGGFSFLPDADGHVLVRRNVADYPPQNGKPALHHEDLMVIYREGGALKATFWDNDDQVIRYAVTTTPQAVMFLSEPGPGPRFRLTYRPTPAGLEGQFEMARPDAPDRFQNFLTWTAKRTK
jgi:hypothetical protein